MKHCDLSSNDPSLGLRKVVSGFFLKYYEFAAFEYKMDDKVVILNAHRDPCGIQIKSGSRWAACTFCPQLFVTHTFWCWVQPDHTCWHPFFVPLVPVSNKDLCYFWQFRTKTFGAGSFSRPHSLLQTKGGSRQRGGVGPPPLHSRSPPPVKAEQTSSPTRPGRQERGAGGARRGNFLPGSALVDY